MFFQANITPFLRGGRTVDDLFGSPREHRTTLSRVFDVLNVDNYVSAGLVRGLIPGNNITVAEGIAGGLRAGNPAGPGYAQGRHIYSDVLGDLGWEPETLGGKVAKGATGFAMDVFLSPATYLTGGVSAVVRGTGRAGARLTHRVGSGLTRETAEILVRGSARAKKMKWTAEEVAQRATKFQKEYDKVVGINYQANKLRWSLKGAPFGEKIFGKHADVGFDIASAERLQEIGERTIAPVYARIRDSILGGEIGKLFSTKSALYRLSKTNPGAVFETVEAADMLRGTTRSILKLKKAIRSKAAHIDSEFAKLSPYEQRELRQLMEDPAQWGQVQKATKFANMQEAAIYRDQMQKMQGTLQRRLDGLTQQKARFEQVTAEEARGGMLETMRGRYREQLLELRDAKGMERTQLEDTIRHFEEEIAELSNEINARTYRPPGREVGEVGPLQTRPITSKDVIDADSALKTRFKEARQFREEATQRRTIEKKLDFEYQQAVERHKPISVTKGYHTRIMNRANEQGFVEYKTSKAAEKFSKNYPHWNEEIVAGTYRFTPPEDVARSWTDAQQMRQVGQLVDYEQMPAADMKGFVDTLSNYLFNKPGMISPNVKYEHLKKIPQMLRQGKTKQEVTEYVLERSRFYSGQLDFISGWMGRRLGYGPGTKYRNWDEFYHQRIASLEAKIQEGARLDENELKLYRNLQGSKLEYDIYASEFINARHTDEIKNVMQRYENKDMLKEIDAIYETHAQRSRQGFAADDAVRGREEFLQTGELTAGHRIKPDYHNLITKEDGARIRQGVLNEAIHDNPKINPNNISARHQKWVNQVEEEVHQMVKRPFMLYSDEEASMLYRMGLQRAKNKSAGKVGENVLKSKHDQILEHAAETKRRLFRDAFAPKVHEGAAVDFDMLGRVQRGRIRQIKMAEDGEMLVDIARRGDDVLFENMSLHDLRGVHVDGRMLSHHDLIRMSESVQDLSRRQEELRRLVTQSKERLQKLDAGERVYLQTPYESLEGQIITRQQRIEERVVELERKRQAQREDIFFNEAKDYEGLLEETRHLEDALQNDEAFELYVRTRLADDATVDAVIGQNNLNVGRVMLNPDATDSAKVKELAEFLRDELIKIGKDEVAIKKLDPGQFEANMMSYLPHMLTDAGRKVFANKQDFLRRFPQMGDELGYGRKWSPHQRTRKLTKIPDGAGGYIENPNITQLNEWMQREYGDILKGKNAFQENIADLYLNRALKHTELMYDDEYMRTMLEVFGRDFTGKMEEGYGLAMNYGMLRKTTSDLSSLEVGIEVSADISRALKDPRLLSELETNAMRRMGLTGRDVLMDQAQKQQYKRFFHEEMNNYIEGYVKRNFPQERLNELYRTKVDEITRNAGTGRQLDDLATPMVELSEEQSRLINQGYERTVGRYTEHIKEKMINYERNKLNEIWRDREHLLRGQERKNFLDEVAGVERKIKKMRNAEDFSTHIEHLRRFADEVDSKRLDDLARKVTRLQETNPVQIKQVNEAIMQKANTARKLQIAKDQSRFLQIYDKVLHYIKLTQTAILPSFHLRNKYTNDFNSALKIGRDVLDVDFQKTAWRTIKQQGNVEDVMRITYPDGRVGSISWKELYEKGMEFDAIGEGFFLKDIGIGAESSGVLSRLFKHYPKHLDPTDTRHFVGFREGKKFGGHIEGQSRLMHFASEVSRGMSFEDAAASSRKFLFDYGDLTAFEQSVMKRIFPYYTWMRKNAPLQMEMMLENPNQYRMFAKIHGGVRGMVNEEDRIEEGYIMDFAKDWVQTPFEADGRTVMWNPNMPYMDFARMPSLTSAQRSVDAVFPQMSPIITKPIEQAINKNVFFDSPIVRPGQSQVARRTDHAFSTFGPYNAIKGFTQKRGSDLGLHTLNTLSGVKFMGYNYDAFKARKIAELAQKREQIKGR